MGFSDFQRRPAIYDYESMSKFVSHMLAWRKKNEPRFSVRSQTQYLSKCTPTLVTNVCKGKRRLRRDHVDSFVSLLNLTSREATYFDQWLAKEWTLENPPAKSKENKPKELSPRRPENHLFSDWINLYVKETVRLKGFKPDAKVIYRLLGKIAPVEQIAGALKFLLFEGFLRRTLSGKIMQNKFLTTTTDGIPDRRLREFHKHALDIAKNGIDKFPFSKRHSGAFIFAIKEEHLPKLKKMLTDWIGELEEFEREYPDGDERLCQVLVNLTPMGSVYAKTN